jgi:HAD superfamily hydrolase (TIGR01509 family)
VPAAIRRLGVIRNVIWDVDGTLFDTYPAIARAFREALLEFGADAPIDEIADLARESLGHCATTLAGRHRLYVDQFEAAFARHYERAAPGDSPPFEGVRRVCELIRERGGQNVIVTHRGPAGTAELLAESGLADCFAGSITRADGYARKPDPAAFKAIIERHGLDRAETIAIGDRAIDMAAGRAAGVRTCFFGPADLDTGADLTIDDFEDLARLLADPDR